MKTFDVTSNSARNLLRSQIIRFLLIANSSSWTYKITENQSTRHIQSGSSTKLIVRKHFFNLSEIVFSQRKFDFMIFRRHCLLNIENKFAYQGFTLSDIRVRAFLKRFFAFLSSLSLFLSLGINKTIYLFISCIHYSVSSSYFTIIPGFKTVGIFFSPQFEMQLMVPNERIYLPGIFPQQVFSLDHRLHFELQQKSIEVFLKLS